MTTWHLLESWEKNSASIFVAVLHKLCLLTHSVSSLQKARLSYDASSKPHHNLNKFKTQMRFHTGWHQNSRTKMQCASQKKRKFTARQAFTEITGNYENILAYLNGKSRLNCARDFSYSHKILNKRKKTVCVFV